MLGSVGDFWIWENLGKIAWGISGSMPGETKGAVYVGPPLDSEEEPFESTAATLVPE